MFNISSYIYPILLVFILKSTQSYNNTHAFHIATTFSSPYQFNFYSPSPQSTSIHQFSFLVHHTPHSTIFTHLLIFLFHSLFSSLPCTFSILYISPQTDSPSYPDYFLLSYYFFHNSHEILLSTKTRIFYSSILFLHLPSNHLSKWLLISTVVTVSIVLAR